MTELHRDELGFEGMTVTDWSAMFRERKITTHQRSLRLYSILTSRFCRGEINNLAGYHRVAEDHKDAARIAMEETTLDMSMVCSHLITPGHLAPLEHKAFSMENEQTMLLKGIRC